MLVVKVSVLGSPPGRRQGERRSEVCLCVHAETACVSMCVVSAGELSRKTGSSGSRTSSETSFCMAGKHPGAQVCVVMAPAMPSL